MFSTQNNETFYECDGNKKPNEKIGENHGPVYNRITFTVWQYFFCSICIRNQYVAMFRLYTNNGFFAFYSIFWPIINWLFFFKYLFMLYWFRIRWAIYRKYFIFFLQLFIVICIKCSINRRYLYCPLNWI